MKNNYAVAVKNSAGLYDVWKMYHEQGVLGLTGFQELEKAEADAIVDALEDAYSVGLKQTKELLRLDAVAALDDDFEELEGF